MKTQPGHCGILGATFEGNGVNFCIWARLASSVELLLFDSETDIHPQIIMLDPRQHRTAYYWHIFIPGIAEGQCYGYRINGPWRPYEGSSFDPEKILLDPYGKEVVLGPNYQRQAACAPGSNIAHCAKNVIVDTRHFDWEDDRPPRHHLSRSVIYEVHVGGFTNHETSGISPHKRGTYAGVIEKIPYLQDLGITAVELLPVYQFDPQDAPDGLNNYWGYSPMSFFAPHSEYSSDDSVLGAINEFRTMVKAFHKANIEVILDVVYNHTAEGGIGGPTFSFKGIDNDIYYILDSATKEHTNFSGCGNTFNASHSVSRRLIMDSLHYWKEVMHVDGFRFDLASILSRGEDGTPLASPPTLWSIDTDPVMAECKLIAEAWDAGGLYQVGKLAGSRWREWNGQFRDDVRQFIKGDANMAHIFSERLIGSPDIYRYQHADPEKSINFVTCHDGFTLWDLVSYNEKHNEANCEQNRDGCDHNYSWNHGVEGETELAQINILRCRQAKNLMAINLLSVGSPMILMGDEYLRTQGGNNNAYCQDNELSWMHWLPLTRGEQMYRFTRELIRYRKYMFSGRGQSNQPQSLTEVLHHSELCWHGTQAYAPDWSENSHALAYSVVAYNMGIALYMVFNAYWEPLNFVLPLPPRKIAGSWRRIMDTSLPSPEDIVPLGEELPAISKTYQVQPRTVCMFICGQEDDPKHLKQEVKRQTTAAKSPKKAKEVKTKRTKESPETKKGKAKSKPQNKRKAE